MGNPLLLWLHRAFRLGVDCSQNNSVFCDKVFMEWGDSEEFQFYLKEFEREFMVIPVKSDTSKPESLQKDGRDSFSEESNCETYTDEVYYDAAVARVRIAVLGSNPPQGYCSEGENTCLTYQKKN